MVYLWYLGCQAPGLVLVGFLVSLSSTLTTPRLHGFEDHGHDGIEEESKFIHLTDEDSIHWFLALGPISCYSPLQLQAHLMSSGVDSITLAVYYGPDFLLILECTLETTTSIRLHENTGFSLARVPRRLQFLGYKALQHISAPVPMVKGSNPARTNGPSFSN